MLFSRPRTPAGELPARLRAVHPYPGPRAAYDPATGSAILGPHADGRPARWPLITPGHGLHSGLIIGGTGSGTSTLATQLAVTAAHTGQIALRAADPHGGSNLPALIYNTPRAALTPRELGVQLDDAVAYLHYWQVRLGVAGQAWHQPRDTEPGLMLIVQDTPGLFASSTSPLTRAALRIAREGRKAAVALIVITSDPSAATIHPQLRDQLAQANLAVLRLPTQAPVPPGIPADPARLPARFPDGSHTAGLGYLPGHPQPFRGWHLTQTDAARHLTDAPRVHLGPQAARGRG